MVRYRGEQRFGTSERVHPQHLPGLLEMSGANRVVGRNLPWENTCLVQAMAGQWMLRRRGLPGKLYLGLARDLESGELLAHAWLRTGEKVLTDGADLGLGYTVEGSIAKGEKS
jgi:hypothetical protein